ncbi:YajG family lipoprotein [Marinomonas epiphytica]
MMKKKLIILLAGASALIAGCTTTHYINIVPEVSVENQQLSNNQVIQVSVNSDLGNQVGEINTGLKEHAKIFTANDYQTSIRQGILQGLKEQGFTPDQGLLPASSIDISITKMHYVTKVETLKTVATLDFELKATTQSKGQTYTANFGSQKITEYGTMPYQKTIEADMNELVTQTVNRLLKDPNILTLLK